MWRVRRREEIVESLSGQKFTVYEFTLSELIIYDSLFWLNDISKLSFLFPQNNILLLTEEEKALLLQKVEEINKEISFPQRKLHGETIKLSLEELIVSFAKIFNKDPLEIIDKYTKNQLLYWQYVYSSLMSACDGNALPSSTSSGENNNIPKQKSISRELKSELKFDELMKKGKEVKK